jgi:hypothetical protein
MNAPVMWWRYGCVKKDLRGGWIFGLSPFRLIRLNAPLLTLDGKLTMVARDLNVMIWEV